MSALMGSASSLVGSRLCSTIPNCERSFSRPQSAQRSSVVVCHANSNKLPEDAPSESSRRSLLLVGAAVAATAAALVNQPDAQAKRKPPPPAEPKRPEDDKNLSALDAKKLANVRRKDALKTMLETAKAKSKQVQEAVKPPTTMNIETTS